MTTKNKTSNRSLIHIDFNSLLPGKIFNIGGENITIYPMNVEQLGQFSKHIEKLYPIFKEKALNLKEGVSDEDIVVIFNIIMEHAPELLSILSGIDMESILLLPAAMALELLSIAIEANLESRTSFEKNSQSLIKLITPLLFGNTAETPAE
jgi:hypothetical protein